MQLTRRDAIKGGLLSAVAGLLGRVRTKSEPESQSEANPTLVDQVEAMRARVIDARARAEEAYLWTDYTTGCATSTEPNSWTILRSEGDPNPLGGVLCRLGVYGPY